MKSCSATPRGWRAPRASPTYQSKAYKVPAQRLKKNRKRKGSAIAIHQPRRLNQWRSKIRKLFTPTFIFGDSHPMMPFKLVHS